MRLIDADALFKHKVTGVIGNLSGDFVPGFAIATAPTIETEPVRHGRWVKAHGMMPPEFFGRHKCSLCGHFALSWKIGHEELSNYCPNCGAKMDAKEGEP